MTRFKAISTDSTANFEILSPYFGKIFVLASFDQTLNLDLCFM